MSLILKSCKPGDRLVAIGRIWIVAICALVLCEYAYAQVPAPGESKSDPKPAVRKPTKAGRDAGTTPERSARNQPKSRAKVQSRSASTRSNRVSSRRGAPTFEMNPDAKLVCENRVVTLDPVWRNGKNLTFPFEIRNGGTADLRIKAKGG